MHLVIFGLTVSSSWGNGHATLWRGLLKAMAARGHTAVFFERDVPYYAGARDGWVPPHGIELRLYSSLPELEPGMRRELQRADAAVVSSYCPDAVAASELIFQTEKPLAVFYDLDTPVTLDALATGAVVPYLPPDGLERFDLILSYTGGKALDELQSRLGAQVAVPLYGWVDPDQHYPAAPHEAFRASLSYIGTYAKDRQAALRELLLTPAQRLPQQDFVIAGAQYPEDFPWAANIRFVQHLEPAQHPAFFGSSRATLNVTRRAMAAYGYCPSGRLFEAAACCTPVVTDMWEGLGEFFAFGTEILPVRCAQDVIDVLSLSDKELRLIGEAARERTLRDHTAERRAIRLEHLLLTAASNRSTHSCACTT